MKIIWLGHGSFRIDIGEARLLVDPWVSGPVFPKERKAEALEGATHILVTHGHFDHTADIPDLAKETGLPVFTSVELAGLLSGQGVENATGFNMGGTVDLNGVEVTMVPALHSTSYEVDGRTMTAGREAGFVIRGEGHCIYFSGDTSISAEMEWIGAYFEPDIGILSCGGHYTMDMKAAAWAAKRYFDFRTVIPGHYRTFPLLEQSAEALAAGLPGVSVIEPEILTPIEI